MAGVEREVKRRSDVKTRNSSAADQYEDDFEDYQGLPPSRFNEQPPKPEVIYYIRVLLPN